MASSLLSNYVALVLVIILWAAIWSIVDAVGKVYLKSHSNRMWFYGSVAVTTSLILVMFFPKHLFL